MKNLVHCFRPETMQHFRHEAIGWTIGFVPEHLPSCPQMLSTLNRNPTPLKGYTSVTTPPLSLHPLCLYLRGFFLSSQQRSQWAQTSSVHSLLSSLARPLTQSFVTTNRLITFPQGNTAFPASNSACLAILRRCLLAVSLRQSALAAI